MRRRELIIFLGGAAAWPLAARGQQQAMPVVGLLVLGSEEGSVAQLAAFRQALNEAGFVEGRNVTIEYRWAAGQFDRVPALAADLVRRQVAVIFTSGNPTALALKAATTTIPIVFNVGEDPVKEGLVASLSRPGGNITGISSFGNLLFAKRLTLLHEIVPKAAAVALLVNPANPNADPDAKDTQTAASAIGRQLHVLTASSERDLETAFAEMVQRGVGGLLVGVDAVFVDHPQRLVAIADLHSMPAIYDRRDFAAAGGLMSYGTKPADAWRQCAIYVSRILKGEKPADLPVQQSTKFDFVINLKTAKALGLTFPPGLLAIADDVIE